MPRSGRPAAPEQRVGDRVGDDVGVGVTRRAPAPSSVDAAEHQRRPSPPNGWTSKPSPTRDVLTNAPASRRQDAPPRRTRSAGVGDLQVARVAGHDDDACRRRPRPARRRRWRRRPPRARRAARRPGTPAASAPRRGRRAATVSTTRSPSTRLSVSATAAPAPRRRRRRAPRRSRRRTARASPAAGRRRARRRSSPSSGPRPARRAPTPTRVAPPATTAVDRRAVPRPRGGQHDHDRVARRRRRPRRRGRRDAAPPRSRELLRPPKRSPVPAATTIAHTVLTTDGAAFMRGPWPASGGGFLARAPRRGWPRRPPRRR